MSKPTKSPSCSATEETLELRVTAKDHSPEAAVGKLGCILPVHSVDTLPHGSGTPLFCVRHKSLSFIKAVHLIENSLVLQLNSCSLHRNAY